MENRIVEAFDRIGERRHDGPLIEVLRQRLLAELFGDGAGVAATLASGFALVMHAGDASLTLAADAVIGSVDAQAAAEVLLWTEFDDLVVDATVVAGSGTLCRMHLAGATLTTTPLAFFLRFDGKLMASEVAFIGGHSETTAIDSDDLPSVERLRSRLASSADA
jgi:hypothetical protein